jgi:membrane protease YdiL (CAAX protease family)
MKPGIYPDHKQLIGLFFILFLFSLVGIIGLTPYFFFKNAHTSAIGTTIIYVVGIGLTIRYAINKIHQSEPSFSVNHFFDFKLNSKMVFLILIATISFIFWTNYVINLFHFKDYGEEEMNQLIKSPFISFFGLSLFPPILEEIFFRGIILQQLFKKYSVTKAIIISGFYFGLFHLNPPQILSAFLGGCFMGWILYKTQNLFYTIIIHFINNLLAFVELYLINNCPQNKFVNQINSLDNNSIVAFGGFIVFGICIYVLQSSFKKIYPALVNKKPDIHQN